MKPKTHNKTKKIRGGRKQTGGFLDGGFLDGVFFDTPTKPKQPASSKPWWKFWESSTTNETSTNETDKQETVVPEEEKEGSPTETGLPDSKSKLADFNGGRRRKRRQRRRRRRKRLL